MDTCFRGSESSVFQIRTHEFHRKTPLLINLASGPMSPNAQLWNARAGEGLGASKVVLGWCQVQAATRDSMCHDPSLQDTRLRQFCMFYIKLKGNPCDVNGVVSQGLVSCLIHVSHLSDSGPTAHIIKVQRRVEAQWSGRSLGTPTCPGQAVAAPTGF